MKKLISKIMVSSIMGLVCAVLLGSLGAPVSGALGSINVDALGSLTIIAEYGGQPVPDCEYRVYQVAELISGDPEYSLIPPFDAAAGEINGDTGVAININNLRKNSGELIEDARILSEYTDGASYREAVSNETLTDLPLGIYLVVQSSAPEDYTSKPFLVYVPGPDSDGAEWVYDIDAKPKIEYNEPTPPPPPPPPPPPEDPTPTPTPMPPPREYPTPTPTPIPPTVTPVPTATPYIEQKLIELTEEPMPIADPKIDSPEALPGVEDENAPPKTSDQTGILEFTVMAAGSLVGLVVMLTIVFRKKPKEHFNK